MQVARQVRSSSERVMNGRVPHSLGRAPFEVHLRRPLTSDR